MISYPGSFIYLGICMNATYLTLCTSTYESSAVLCTGLTLCFHVSQSPLSTHCRR